MAQKDFKKYKTMGKKIEKEHRRKHIKKVPIATSNLKQKKITDFKKDFRRRIKEGPMLLYIFLAFIIMVSIFQLFRTINSDSWMAGTEPYYHLRIARQILENGAVGEDGLSFGGRPYIFNPYDYLLAFCGKFVSIETASKILPFIFSIIAMIFFYLLMKKAELSLITRGFILICLVATPAFLYSAMFSNSEIAGIAMLLIGFYLFIGKKESSFLFSMLFFIAASLFSFINFISAVLISAFYTYKHAEKRTKFVLLLLSFLCISPLYQLMFYRYGIPELPFKFGLAQLLAELGALEGISIFGLILAVIGFFVLWNERAKFYLPYALLFFFAAAFILNANINLYLAFIISIFAGSALTFLIERRWWLKLVRNISLALILFGLFFSAISFVGRASASEPYPQLMNSLSWLDKNSRYQGIVFSHYKNGFWIEYFNKKSVTDENFIYAPELYERLNDSNEIFYSRNLERTEELLDKYNISYILITPDMKQGLVWKKEEEGLLFLLRNHEIFSMVHAANSSRGIVEIWKYTKK